MLQRHISKELHNTAAKMPVVTLMGPRQSGKTTLMRASFAQKPYVSLELPHERAEALEDPLGFLARFPDGAILDEVQRVPDLLSYIQVDVDQNDQAGRWLLTGSQNLLLMRTVAQSLAGRSAILTLLPLSLTELRGHEPIILNELDSCKVRHGDKVNHVKNDVWQSIWSGFYPRIHDKNLDPSRWLADYYRTYVERDLRDLLQVANLDRFDRFVRLLAAHSAQELNMSSLAADAGISQPTAKAWLSALNAGFVVQVLPPFYQNYRKRLRKRGKLHFLDTGLACYLLGIRSVEILRNHPMRGALFESFVVSELIKAFVHSGQDAPLYHWRDAAGHEIDIIMDMGERQIPVEVKAGQTVPSDALRHLRWWTGMKTNPNIGGVLVHGGAAQHMRQDFCIRPWWIG